MHKKKVFLHAYMAGNLGDDLMVRILCERYQNVQFLLYADSSYKERFADLKNLKIYAPTDKLSNFVNRFALKVKEINNAMWKLLIKVSDCTVHIGGSVFVQHLEDFKPAYDVDYDLRMRSKKMYVIGANFGPFTNEAYYDAYRELFKKYDGICFRDSYSKALFREYSNIKCAPDVVFNYAFPKGIAQKKQVLFSVISLDERGGKYSICQYADEYYQMLAGMAEYYINNGYIIKMVSFCRFQKDEEAIENIISRIPEEHRRLVSKVFYDKNEKEIINTFAESELVVGTRFHSIILGWLAGKKVLPIVYDSKIIHILEDNHCSFYITMEEIEQLNREGIDKTAERLMEDIVFQPEMLIKDAVRQFHDLDKELM